MLKSRSHNLSFGKATFAGSAAVFRILTVLLALIARPICVTAQSDLRLNQLRAFFVTNGPTDPESLRALVRETKPDLGTLFQFFEEGAFPQEALRLISVSLAAEQQLPPEFVAILSRKIQSLPNDSAVQHAATRLLLERQSSAEALQFLDTQIDGLSDRASFEAIRWLSATAAFEDSASIRLRAIELLKRILSRLTAAASEGKGQFSPGFLGKDAASTAFAQPELAGLLVDYLLTRLHHIETLSDDQQMMALLTLFKVAKLGDALSLKVKSALSAEIVRGPAERTQLWLWHLHRQDGFFTGNELAQNAVSNALQRLPNWSDYAERLRQGQVDVHDGFWTAWSVLRERAGHHR